MCTNKDTPEKTIHVKFLSPSCCVTYKMTTRQLNIKDSSYHFYNDLINVLNFEASNSKLDEKNIERH